MHLHRGNNSVVECQLPKLKVASSNLVSRSKKTTKARSVDRAFFYLFSDSLKKFFPPFSPLFSSYSFLFKVGLFSKSAQIVP